MTPEASHIKCTNGHTLSYRKNKVDNAYISYTVLLWLLCHMTSMNVISTEGAFNWSVPRVPLCHNPSLSVGFYVDCSGQWSQVGHTVQLLKSRGIWVRLVHGVEKFGLENLEESIFFNVFFKENCTSAYLIKNTVKHIINIF